MRPRKALFRQKIRSFVQKFPGYSFIGPYVFLPLFFISGACLEFAMIKWEPNGHNFYKTFKRKQAEERARALYIEYLRSRRNQESVED